MGCRSRLIYVYTLLLPPLLFLLLRSSPAHCEVSEDNWIEPNILSRPEDDSDLLSLSLPHLSSINEELSCQCDQRDASNNDNSNSNNDNNDGIASMYYKKFVATLFNRKKLQYDERLRIYRRSFHFTILPAQLERLERLSDPRDLDSVLTELVASARFFDHDNEGGSAMGFLALVKDILKDMLQLMKISEVRFVLLAAFAIVLGYLIHRRYGIGIVTLIIGSFLLFGYFVTYLECNKKLEVEQMLEVLELAKDQEQQNARYWYTPFVEWFGSSDPVKEIRKEQIRKSSRLNLAYCRPDHVLLMYANELFLKQLEFLLEKCTDTFITLKDKLSFPYNYLAAVMMIVLIASILKWTFKYILSPKAWAGLMHRPYTNAAPNIQQQQQQQQMPPLLEDRLSGENLKLLLNAFSTPNIALVNNVTAAQSTRPVSGVQDVMERLGEAPTTSTKSTPTHSSADSSLSSNDSDTLPSKAETESLEAQMLRTATVRSSSSEHLLTEAVRLEAATAQETTVT